MKRGQVGTEYVMVIGISLLLIIPIIILFGQEHHEISQSVSHNQANEIIKKVIDASEKVYYLGYPSVMTIKAYMPTHVEDINVSMHTVTFTLDKDSFLVDIHGYTDVNLSGSISHTPGIKHIRLENVGGRVNISSK